MSNPSKFMQFQLQKLERDQEEIWILNGTDVSKEILYDQAKAQQEFQEISVACVSHEMKNPLNSICAMNVVLREAFSQIERALGEETNTQIKEALKIQHDSSQLLIFMVKNMLDYAQIKAGKFRKDITVFDIRTCVDMVMSFQSIQAKEKNIYLNAQYIGFEDNFMIKSDQQRLA